MPAYHKKRIISFFITNSIYWFLLAAKNTNISLIFCNFVPSKLITKKNDRVDSRGIEAAFLANPSFGQIAETADALGMECYVVGGYVRDIFLQRPSKDIDVVVVGSGIAMAEALGKQLGRGAHVSVFKNFGTAQVKNIEARK